MRRILATLAVAGMATVANGGVASAATSTDLRYSVDGGATWSSDITAAPGQTVLVRQWFDNTDRQNHAGSSVTTDIPAGFTRVSGSTPLPQPVDRRSPEPGPVRAEVRGQR